MPTPLRLSTSIDAPVAIDHLVDWLIDYLDGSGLKGWVVGVSGGIDSAVVSALLARTGRPVLALRLPIHQAESQDNRGARHIAALETEFDQVSSACVDLTRAFDHWKSDFELANQEISTLGEANARARLRMTTLYAAAAERDALVVGTGNRVEDFGVGFYTKYGDGGVDLSPIANLYKSEVFALGSSLGVAQEILDAAPTDGLWGDGRTDEEQLGATYEELEWAMEHWNEGDAVDILETLQGRAAEVMEIFQRLNRANQHKMRPIPVAPIPLNLRTVAR